MTTFNPAFRPPAGRTAQRFIHVVGSSVFVDDRPADDAWPQHFLGLIEPSDSSDVVACWGVDVPHGDDPSYGAALDLYSYFGRATEVDWLVAGRAVQLVDWARTHRFCGRCGTATEPQSGERAMRCPACGLLAFPRLALGDERDHRRGEPGPDQQVLLARGVNFRAPVYSCLAGFVEPGETLEGAVVREVREEVGVEVTDVRYWGSQPWPFPHSLMLGFTARWVGGEIECDPTEIVDAQWYTRDSMPAVPPPVSIARKIIDEWVTNG